MCVFVFVGNNTVGVVYSTILAGVCFVSRNLFRSNSLGFLVIFFANFKHCPSNSYAKRSLFAVTFFHANLHTIKFRFVSQGCQAEKNLTDENFTFSLKNVEFTVAVK